MRRCAQGLTVVRGILHAEQSYFLLHPMSNIEPHEVERVMQALPPEARLALNTMAELQRRPVEDVLRDEIARYIEGKVPAIDIDSAMEGIKATAWQAGYFIGRLHSFARRMNDEE